MTSLISYAQNFEDIMLWRALSHVESTLHSTNIQLRTPAVLSNWRNSILTAKIVLAINPQVQQ